MELPARLRKAETSSFVALRQGSRASHRGQREKYFRLLLLMKDQKARPPMTAPQLEQTSVSAIATLAARKTAMVPPGIPAGKRR